MASQLEERGFGMATDESPLGEPPQGWTLARLADIAAPIGSGATPRGGSAVYLPYRQKFALVRSQNVFDRRFDNVGLAYISDGAASGLSGASLAPDDLLLNITGDGVTFGRACLMPQEVLPACVNQHVVRVRCNRRKCEPKYLLSYLTHPTVKHYIEGFNSGGSRRAITKGHIESFVVPLPPLPEQKAIARVLGALDDKIELNRRMNRTLEDLARGLFKSWFVDFDPVVKSGGSKGSGAPEGLFPKRLVESALGLIPEGWRVGTVANLCSTQYGYTASATDEADGPRMLRVTDMNKEPWIEWADVPHCHIDDNLLLRYALAIGDVLVSRMADPGKAAIVEELLPEGAVFASYLIRLVTRSIPSSYYLFYFLRSDRYLDYAESVSGGTVQKNMNAHVITAAQMVVPSGEVVAQFARLVRPWRAQISANLQQSRALAALRDALLPQLLSGEIRLHQAEHAVAEAV